MVEDWNIILSVLESPDPSVVGQQKVFSSSPINIGRADDNDFIVSDPTISRHHVTLRITNDYSRVFITDQSTHGTTVSDKPVPKGLGAAFTVHDGDTIKMGDTLLKFELRLKTSVQSTFVGKMDRSFLDTPPDSLRKETVNESDAGEFSEDKKNSEEKKAISPFYMGIIVICILILVYLIFFQK
jgi:pSer/pThr/pTyr-binding forkhead associated (FHA) protein